MSSNEGKGAIFLQSPQSATTPKILTLGFIVQLGVTTYFSFFTSRLLLSYSKLLVLRMLGDYFGTTLQHFWHQYFLSGHLDPSRQIQYSLGKKAFLFKLIVLKLAFLSFTPLLISWSLFVVVYVVILPFS